MSDKTIAPFGSWKSPITPDLLLTGSVGLMMVDVDGEAVFWAESRPLEGGRSVIVRWTAEDGLRDVTPTPFNARTRVHEYGGGEFAVHQGVVYFANYADQRLYRQKPGQAPEAVTPDAALRYADMQIDAARNRLICVREDHRGEGEAVNALAAVPLDEPGLSDDGQQVLASGHDFFASPRLSPDGRRLAWLTWDHPNMPWDGTELWLADIAGDGALENVQRIAGGRTESVFQPEWSPPDESGRSMLHFVSDRSGWWNLYRLRDGRVEALYPAEAEFGLPQWVFGMSTYAFESPTSIVCTFSRNGRRNMARLDTTAGRLAPLELPYTGTGLRTGAGHLVFIGGSPTRSSAVVRVNLANDQAQVLRESSNVAVDEGYLSIARPIEYPTANGLTAHAYYYPPQNKDYEAPAEERPPLIVTSHGGPTSTTNPELNLNRQYWTSRGFAVLDVNYGGSTGYGRAYRERLSGQWGVVDVEDCLYGARYLVEQDLVDGDRLIIRGGSAGGYTTLCAITFHRVFKAAASYFGVSDAEALAKETHKFESRYLDSLIGPYPQAREVYMARSPIHYARQCSAALILFQGMEDEIVPPNQSEAMFVAARAKELPVAYLTFEGEQHGFRKAENIKRTLEAELYFYSRVFGFDLAEPVEPIEIENLEA